MNDPKVYYQEAAHSILAGFFLDAFQIVVACAMRWDKKTFLDEISRSIATLQDSLSEEQKKELQNLLSQKVDEKVDAFQKELRTVLTEEEIAKVLPELLRELKAQTARFIATSNES